MKRVMGLRIEDFGLRIEEEATLLFQSAIPHSAIPVYRRPYRP
jgi:hypothetical protein